MANAHVLPELTHLGIAGSDMLELEFDVFETLLGSPLMKQLRALELHGDASALQQISTPPSSRSSRVS